jgi:hypothetical protein
MLRVVCKVLVIAAACFVTGAKLRHHGAACPLSTAQELNRCLSLLRAASARNAPAGVNKRYAFGIHDR